VVTIAAFASVVGRVDVPRGALMQHATNVRSPILIAEDHTDTREMYAWYLRTRGFWVVEASNGRTALHRARHFKPALIVVDLSLPVMATCLLVKTLRIAAETRTIPIVGLNGYGYRQYAERALEAGCDSVLVKPCFPDVLADQIEQMLDLDRSSISFTQSPAASL
jgi:CheY-like chemotaxis protein